MEKRYYCKNVMSFACAVGATEKNCHFAFLKDVNQRYENKYKQNTVQNRTRLISYNLLKIVLWAKQRGRAKNVCQFKPIVVKI